MKNRAHSFIIELAVLVLVCSLGAAQTKQKKESHTISSWRVQVVDESGRPVKNVLVRQKWQNYDVEKEGHHEDARTDDNGYVTFPARVIKSKHAAKALARLKHIATLGVHADYGVGSQVWAYGEDPHFWSFVNYEPGKPLPDKIVLKRWEVKIYP